MKSNITIKQIAKESNVSMATVSRYLNGTAVVSDSKRRQIEAVIQKHHFSPNPHARSLSSGRTMTLGIVIPDISNPYFYSLFLEIQKQATAGGYTLLLYNTSFSQENCEHTEEAYFRKLIQHRVDGVLVLGGQIDLLKPSASYLAALHEMGEYVPVVVMGAPISGSSCCFVDIEAILGVSVLFRHLYELGHREIAFIGGNTGVRITEARLNAYKAQLSAHHIPENPDYIALTDYYAEEGYRAAEQLLERTKSFTAVIAANDNVAIGAVRAFYDHGLSVPEKVSIASCDHFLAGSYSVPRITGISRDTGFIGRLLMQRLLHAVSGDSENISVTPRIHLLVRESCRAIHSPERQKNAGET